MDLRTEGALTCQLGSNRSSTRKRACAVIESPSAGTSKGDYALVAHVADGRLHWALGLPPRHHTLLFRPTTTSGVGAPPPSIWRCASRGYQLVGAPGVRSNIIVTDPSAP